MEQEYEAYVSKSDLVNFLRKFVEQLESGDEIALQVSDGEIRFGFAEPIKVQVEHDVEDGELKIKIKMREKRRKLEI